MSNISRNDILDLLNELESFESFVKRMSPYNVPYFIRYIDRMRYNIQTYITIGSYEVDKISKTLQRDWKEAKEVFLETPGFYLDEVDDDREKENIFKFCRYVRVIDSYVKK